MLFVTPREHDVWRLTASGLSTKEITVKLGLSRSTIWTYRDTLYSKLGVDSAILATLAAVKFGVVEVHMKPDSVTIVQSRGRTVSRRAVRSKVLSSGRKRHQMKL